MIEYVKTYKQVAGTGRRGSWRSISFEHKQAGSWRWPTKKQKIEAETHCIEPNKQNCKEEKRDLIVL